MFEKVESERCCDVKINLSKRTTDFWIYHSNLWRKVSYKPSNLCSVELTFLLI